MEDTKDRLSHIWKIAEFGSLTLAFEQGLFTPKEFVEFIRKNADTNHLSPLEADLLLINKLSCYSRICLSVIGEEDDYRFLIVHNYDNIPGNDKVLYALIHRLH